MILKMTICIKFSHCFQIQYSFFIGFFVLVINPECVVMSFGARDCGELGIATSTCDAHCSVKKKEKKTFENLKKKGKKL